MLSVRKLSLCCAVLLALDGADARLVLWKYKVPLLSLARDFTAAASNASASLRGICDDPVNAPLPFCDSSLSPDQRLDDLVSRVPMSAVGELMVDGSTGFLADNIRLPAYQWWNEALHGVGVSKGVSFRGDTLFATSFPQVISTSHSFNRTLFYRIGEVISTEARCVLSSLSLVFV
jgi:xylan 1,4-beta-xylosidase